MGQESFAGRETANPAWPPSQTLNEHGNRISLPSTTAQYVIPGQNTMTQHRGFRRFEGEPGGATDSETVTLPGGVTVYFPDALQDPLPSEGGAQPRSQVCKSDFVLVAFCVEP